MFRHASLDDTEAVVRLINNLIVELGGSPLDETAAIVAVRDVITTTGAGAILVAEDESTAKLIGVCSLSYQTAIRTTGRYAIVQEMFIVPERRSARLGASLLEAAVSAARNDGCGVVELGTPPGGERQAGFYLRNGFVAVGLRMRKVLAP